MKLVFVTATTAQQNEIGQSFVKAGLTAASSHKILLTLLTELQTVPTEAFISKVNKLDFSTDAGCYIYPLPTNQITKLNLWQQAFPQASFICFATPPEVALAKEQNRLEWRQHGKALIDFAMLNFSQTVVADYQASQQQADKLTEVVNQKFDLSLATIELPNLIDCSITELLTLVEIVADEELHELYDELHATYSLSDDLSSSETEKRLSALALLNRNKIDANNKVTKQQNLEAEKEQLEAEKWKLETKNKQFQAEINKLETSLNAGKEKAEAVKQAHQHALQQLQSQFKSSQEENEALQGEKTELEANQSQLIDQYSKLEYSYSQIETHNSELVSETELLQLQINQLQEELEYYYIKYSKLSEQVQVLNSNAAENALTLPLLAAARVHGLAH